MRGWKDWKVVSFSNSKTKLVFHHHQADPEFTIVLMSSWPQTSFGTKALSRSQVQLTLKILEEWSVPSTVSKHTCAY